MALTFSGVSFSGGFQIQPTFAPDAPTVGSATATGSTTATVAFTAPSNSGSSTITSYTATSSPGNITGTLNQAGSGTINVTGLTASTSYTFTVTATNSVGTSSASSASNSITTQSAVPTIGQAYGGGYYAGKINVSGTQYYLVVAPKSTGEASGLQYGPQGTVTGATSTINGPANTTNLAARGATYQAAYFCENLTIDGYTDWYLPALNELEVCYYFLKPGTTPNTTFYGANPNAVSPEPINTNYTTGSPAQTSATNFRTGANDQEFVASLYWTSTETSNNDGYTPNMDDGLQYNVSKTFARYVRAVRRVPV